MDEQVERVAKAIYLALNDDPANGVHAKEWKTDAPWDSNPAELCEWERDEYRDSARAAIAAVGDDGCPSCGSQDHDTHGV